MRGRKSLTLSASKPILMPIRIGWSGCAMDARVIRRSLRSIHRMG
jgi:hypothetical protein